MHVAAYFDCLNMVSYEIRLKIYKI